MPSLRELGRRFFQKEISDEILGSAIEGAIDRILQGTFRKEIEFDRLPQLQNEGKWPSYAKYREVFKSPIVMTLEMSPEAGDRRVIIRRSRQAFGLRMLHGSPITFTQGELPFKQAEFISFRGTNREKTRVGLEFWNEFFTVFEKDAVQVFPTLE